MILSFAHRDLVPLAIGNLSREIAGSSLGDGRSTLLQPVFQGPCGHTEWFWDTCKAGQTLVRCCTQTEFGEGQGLKDERG